METECGIKKIRDKVDAAKKLTEQVNHSVLTQHRDVRPHVADVVTTIRMVAKTEQRAPELRVQWRLVKDLMAKKNYCERPVTSMLAHVLLKCIQRRRAVNRVPVSALAKDCPQMQKHGWSLRYSNDSRQRLSFITKSKIESTVNDGLTTTVPPTDKQRTNIITLSSDEDEAQTHEAANPKKRMKLVRRSPQKAAAPAGVGQVQQGLQQQNTNRLNAPKFTVTANPADAGRFETSCPGSTCPDSYTLRWEAPAIVDPTALQSECKNAGTNWSSMPDSTFDPTKKSVIINRQTQSGRYELALAYTLDTGEESPFATNMIVF